ncbi:hypothetical protein [Glycomyces sp. NPDC048151]|uniref:hypothetical protein n=1 Tax=Glycomyces sp. NPDC048151 TaxID=3364002 RepID=UPI003710BD69
MSKKHFIALAAMIAGLDVDESTRETLILEIGMVCKSQNSRFSWQTFREACQPAK